MIQIYINGRFLSQSVTGVQRYAMEVVKSLDLLLDGAIDQSRYSFVLLTPKNQQVELHLKHIRVETVGRWTGHVWEQFELPYYSRAGLLVNLCNTGPLLRRYQIVTVHDAAVFVIPQNFSFAFRVWYRFLLRRLGKAATTVITVSRFSCTELQQFCHIPEYKLKVVYEGKEHMQAGPADVDVIRHHALADRPFVLAVSSMSPNKNFQNIVRAVEFLASKQSADQGYDVVIVGGTNPKVFSSVNTELPDSVKYLGYVSDSELKALYENAACFIYPSFYEGFGLPPLEAMACGCPVIVSSVASLPEVCGEAALYCDPSSPEDIAYQVDTLMHDKNLREQLRQRGMERASKFSWVQCAAEVLSVIEETSQNALTMHL